MVRIPCRVLKWVPISASLTEDFGIMAGVTPWHFALPALRRLDNGVVTTLS